MDLLAFILGRSGPFFDFLVKSPLNLSGLNINVCPHYSHQLSKQESFKVVDSLVVFRCFIIFMGGSFSKHWFMGGLGYLIGKQLLGGVFSGLMRVYPRATAFSSLIQVGFWGGFLLTEDACMKSEISRHFFCINNSTCWTDFWNSPIAV